MRVAALLAIAALATAGVALALASGDEAKSDQSGAVERTVKKAVRVAVIDRNYVRACRFGTPRGRRRLLFGYNSSAGPDFPNCAAILRHEVEEPVHRAWIARLKDGVLVDVLWVQGPSARVWVADGPGESAGGGYVRLRRLNGRWRFDNSSLIPYGD